MEQRDGASMNESCRSCGKENFRSLQEFHWHERVCHQIGKKQNKSKCRSCHARLSGTNSDYNWHIKSCRPHPQSINLSGVTPPLFKVGTPKRGVPTEFV